MLARGTNPGFGADMTCYDTAAGGRVFSVGSISFVGSLIGDPQLLLLDEPSLGLSPVLVKKIFDIIQKIIKEEKCSIVLVEQNTAKALEISDYIFMMSSGVLIGEGTSEQFMKNEKLIKELLGFH